MMIYFLAINDGVQQTMQDLALSWENLQLNNMATDIATLVWTSAQASDECPIHEGDTVDLYADERRLFRGRARVGGVRPDGCAITLLGPWNELERHYFQYSLLDPIWPKLGGTFVIAYGPEEEWWDGSAWRPFPPFVTYTYVATGPLLAYDGGDTGECNVNLLWTGGFWLFAPVFGPYISMGMQLGRIWNQMFTLHPGVMTVASMDIGALAAPKPIRVQDVKMAEAVRQTVLLKPDIAMWWDYQVGNALHGRVASLESPMILTVGTEPLQDYEVDLLHELVPSGVMIRWQDPFEGLYGPSPPVLLDSYPLDTVGYQADVLIQTVDAEVQRTVGLAYEIYESLSVLRSQGTIQLFDPHFSLGLRPGMVIEIDGDDTLEGAQHWVQQVQWSPATGEAILTVGYPRHIGLEDRLSQREWLRRAFFGPRYTFAQVMPGT